MNACQASRPRRPGSSASTNRSRSVVRSASERTCTCKENNPDVLAVAKVAAGPATEPDQPGEGAQMITEDPAELDRSIHRRFDTAADKARVERTAAALQANGMTVF